ncbi:MAG: hypothetical protein EXS35_04890 [Pedosphaera sp.]|nr:hypothetical protein [Pedosphaera sp.]
MAETNPTTNPPAGYQPLSWWRAVLLALMAVVCFHAAYTPALPGPWALAIIGYVAGLIQLARLRTTRQSFYAGLAVGFACGAPQLIFFWKLFGAGAIALWLVLAFWTSVFVALAHCALVRFGPMRGALLIPFLWTGLEYFRSELYYLKFSWLNVGYTLAEWPFMPIGILGMYGVGFAVVFFAVAIPAICRFLRQIEVSLIKLVFLVFLIALFAAILLPGGSSRIRPANFVLAGVQLEFPTPDEIKMSLDKIISAQANVPLKFYRASTNTDLIVLPEYTLDGEPTQELKDWCRENRKFLIVGGRDSSPGTNYFNTAFVISTNGEVVFKQVKCTPIQFFTDGLPATEQKVWESPWGKIGICICYDFSYTRVTDELVRQGAQMLIVPTMDVADWGRHQHELHARVAPVRAAEYGIPIFRVASSGISQGVSRNGQVQASAPFPGEGEILFFGAQLPPGRKGSLPLDRYLAPACVVVTGIFIVWLVVERLRRKKYA